MTVILDSNRPTVDSNIGPNNLDKLRVYCYNENDWEEFWERENLAVVSSPLN